MPEWPRFYFMDENLEWLLGVRPDGDGFTFLVARDGWLLLEASFEISAGISYHAFIDQFLLDLRSPAFHRKFHEVAKEYAPGVPTFNDCPGCPWTCERKDVWTQCFEDWAWRIPQEVRRGGCRMFIHDDALMAEASKT